MSTIALVDNQYFTSHPKIRNLANVSLREILVKSVAPLEDMLLSFELFG